MGASGQDAGAQAILQRRPTPTAPTTTSCMRITEVARVGHRWWPTATPTTPKVDLSALVARMRADSLIVAVRSSAAMSPDLRSTAGFGWTCWPAPTTLSGRVAGAKGWIAGYPNTLPATSVKLWDLSVAKDLDRRCRSTVICTRCCGGTQARFRSGHQAVDGHRRSQGRPCRARGAPCGNVAAAIRKDTERRWRGYR